MNETLRLSHDLSHLPDFLPIAAGRCFAGRLSFLLVLAAGVLYGLFTVKAMKRLTTAVQEISIRSYLPVQDHGAFHDLYESLNTLDTEIRASDQLRVQTEKMREEWIANITHDLKTPLSPIKGYAELLGGADRRPQADLSIRKRDAPLTPGGAEPDPLFEGAGD